MNNNKQNAKQGNNQSDIITKKGFLISIPQGKKQSEGQSSINFAKANGQKVENDGEKKRFDNKKDGGKKKFDKKQGEKKSAEVRDNKHESKSEVRDGKGGVSDKNGNHHNQSQGKNRHGKNGKRGGFDKNDRREGNITQSGGQRQQNPAASDKGDNRQGQSGHGKNRHDKHPKGKEKKMAPLSALSSDIASYAKHKSEAEEMASVAPQLSLEEKYRNAKPLSQQIAEQEMRQKGIKVPYDNEIPEEREEQEIVGVRFREAGKVYYFDPDGKQVPFGTPVIVETARGSEYGFIAISNRTIPVASLSAPLKKLERVATTADTQKHVYNKDMEKDAEVIFKEKVEKLGLPMNLIYVEYTFDNSRLLFYFTAETRIDFRELVKELASVFRTRIELRQIGVRDEAKTIGGLGICGRATCCNTFLGDFAQVSIKMAKDQNLSLNAAKISGACGKLMCCLRYEDKVYEEENARTPKVGSVVETLEGKGVVTEARALKGIVIVALENSPETPPKAFHRDEVTVVGFNKSIAKSGDEDESELKHLEN